MKKLLIFCTSLLLLSCGFYYQKGTNLNSKTNYFKAPKIEVSVLTEVAIPTKDLKPLLLVQYERGLEIARNLNFFDEVMTTDQFEDAIIKGGFADDIKSIRDKKGLHKAATLIRPFVLLEHYHGERFLIEGFRLYDPKTEKIIFENEMNDGFFGPTNESRLFPLYNSLLDYLRKQH